MTKYIVQGGHPLFGEVHISGAKNAAVAIIPAALLVDGVCRIENIPQISDVTALLKILEQLGANVRFLNRSDVEIDCRHIATTQVSQELAHKIRASYYLIGALLGRFGEAEVSMPGGCNFGGVRPIDQHVKGFAAMGAEVREGDFICAKASGDRMKGANVYLDVVSVGATMNIMMAAALADGTTVIENAAKEPHIVDLANFLNSMGANIKGAGTDTIRIFGVDKLHGGTYAIIPDQIEAGTYMAAVAACGGQVLVRGIIPKKVRIACFIVIAASLVVAVELLMQAYAYPLYQQLGIFVPLIVVNCIILARAEAFAAKNGVAASVADGLGIGLGYTISLTFLGSLREILGNGTWFGNPVMWDGFQPFTIMVQAPGAFICLGLILAGMNVINVWQSRRKGGQMVETSSCGGCKACSMIQQRQEQ